MPVPGHGYSITVRVEAPASSTAAGDLTTAVGRVGGVLTAFDVVESHSDRIVVDISANALSENHANHITQTLDSLPGVHVRKVSDRTFLIHLAGKIEVPPKVALRNRDDLSRAYTTGAARGLRQRLPRRGGPRMGDCPVAAAHLAGLIRRRGPRPRRAVGCPPARRPPDVDGLVRRQGPGERRRGRGAGLRGRRGGRRG